MTINIKGVTSGQPLPTIRYRVSIDADAAAGTYQNTATLTSDNAQVVADSSAAALTSDASVRVISQGGYTVQNTSNGTEFAVNQPFTFNYLYSNKSGGSYLSGMHIAVLPYNGDDSNDQGGLASSRLPGSKFTDTRTNNTHVALASVPTGQNGEVFEYSTTPSGQISLDPCAASNLPAGYVPVIGNMCYNYYSGNGNTLPGGGTQGSGTTVWLATPPTDLSAVTAFRFKTTTQAGHTTRTVSATMQPSGNQPGDTYCSSFGGRIPDLVFNIISNDVCVKVPGASPLITPVASTGKLADTGASWLNAAFISAVIMVISAFIMRTGRFIRYQHGSTLKRAPRRQFTVS